MRTPISIFLSAVSREFHNPDPADPQRFVSYREYLAESLRAVRQPSDIILYDYEAMRRCVDASRRPGLIEKIVPEIAGKIKKPDPARVFLPDRAGMAAWVAALDTVAATHGLDRRALTGLLDERLGYLLENAEASQDASDYLDLGFTYLALGEYAASIEAAERAAALALANSGATQDDDFLNAQSLIHSAAAARHDPARAMRAQQEGGARIDRE